MKCFINFLAVLGFLAVSTGLSAAEPSTSPYGICAHLAGGGEFELMPKNLQMMKAAGIEWVRADFGWSGVQKADKSWNFDRLDRVVEMVEKEGMTVLPILDYDVPWATPAYKHLDAWTAYVEKVVSRYKDRIKYWEVWNEQNLDGFWRERPDAKNYQILLEASYNTIKKIDPNLQVVYGGLSGIPFEYIETSLQAGAGKYFDVFNIHPYRPGMTNLTAVEGYLEELKRLRTLLDNHDAKGKPIWITEFGWATPPGSSAAHLGILTAAEKLLCQKGKRWKIAVLRDERYAESGLLSDSVLAKILPKGVRPTFITFDDIKTLKPSALDALLLPPSELCPTPFFDDIVKYVKDGGTLILLGGVPLYYDMELVDGRLVRKAGAPDARRNALRIGWKAWWHVKDDSIPKEVPLTVAPEAAEGFRDINITGVGARFVTADRLKEGDKLIPLLNGKKDGFEGSPAAILKFNSDYKGAVVVSMLMGQNVNVTEEDQADYLQQAILLSLHGGVERYFWYEFQAPEIDPVDRESHFGIVHRDLSPKPAYGAYKRLTQMRPNGSTPLNLRVERDKQMGFVNISWKRPDNVTVEASWRPGTGKVEFREMKRNLSPNRR